MDKLSRILISATFLFAANSAHSQVSPDCTRKLMSIFCWGCTINDEGVTPAYKKGPGGISGACHQCLNVRCGDVDEEEDKLLSGNESGVNQSTCRSVLSDFVVTNAVVDQQDLLTIARSNPAVAIAIFGQQYGTDEVNPAGLGGITAFTKTFSFSDVELLVANPDIDVGTPLNDMSGILVEPKIFAEDAETITYEYRAVRVSVPNETRIQDGPIILLTFSKDPAHARVVGSSPEIITQGLRLTEVAVKPEQ